MGGLEILAKFKIIFWNYINGRTPARTLSEEWHFKET